MAKKRSTGVLILSIYLVFISATLLFATLYSFGAIVYNRNNSISEKQQLLEKHSDSYKQLNVSTVEEFDEYWKNYTAKTLNAKILIPTIAWFVITIGFCLLLNWARIGLICLKIFKLGLNLFWAVTGQPFDPVSNFFWRLTSKNFPSAI